MVTAMAPNIASMNSNNSNSAMGRQSIADLTTSIKSTKGDIPPPLVGASTTIIGDNIYVFGGRVASSRQMTNHLYILHLPTLVWVRHIAPPDSASAPVPRYFHSASTYLDRYIVVFGGMGNTAGSKRARLQQQQQQQMSNGDEQLSAMDDVSMFDIDTMCWIEISVLPSIFTPQARYAHLSTVWDSSKLVVMGGQDIANQHINEINVFDLKEMAWVHGGPMNGPYDAYRAVAFCPQPNTNNTTAFGSKGSFDYFWNSSPSDEPQQQQQQQKQPAPPVCVYSNYNFNDLTRELQSFYPMKSAHAVEFRNHAAEMTGSLLPPGLRFPTGQLMGQYFVVSGTFLSSTKRGFQVWALNLTNLTWSHIDTSSNLSNGSWNRGLLSNQKYYVLGHGQRDLKDDYSYRRTNFDHIATIDLEAYGIYCLPHSTCSSEAQELGLSMLNEPSITDLTIWTSDQQAIPINSIILAERWPGFAQLLHDRNTSTATKTTTDTLLTQKKQLLFPESYSVTLAFLQYIYSDHLITAQQHQPQILCRLLILADMYKMNRLLELTTYALHQLLTISTASMVYETAALTFQSALQIRALRIMINAKRMLLGQQNPQSKEMPSTPQHNIHQHQQLQQSLSSPTQQNYEQFHHQVEFTSFSATTSPSTSTPTGSLFSDEPQSPMSFASSVPSSQSYATFRRLQHQQIAPPSPVEKFNRYMPNSPVNKSPISSSKMSPSSSSSSPASTTASNAKSAKKQGYFDYSIGGKYLTAFQ
ncbi:unnamed protein product [Mucor circinelloides]